MTRLSAFSRWHRATSEVAAALAALCVMIVAFSYSAEVAARYFFSAPLNWAGDLSSYLLCVCVFLALPKVTNDGSHVSVGLLLEAMSQKHRRRYVIFLRYVTAGVFIFTAYFVADEGVRQFQENVLTHSSNQIPRWWISAVVFFGLTSSALHLLEPYDSPDRDSGDAL